MPTKNQALGEKGESAVAQRISCPRCNKPKQLTRLPANFQCADVICKFCGFLAQVKATKLRGTTTELPAVILGAAWGPQHEQIIAGIYHGLYVVCYDSAEKLVRIDFIPAHILQVTPEVFEPRKPLSESAKRAGWQGFMIRLDKLPAVGVKRVY
jgi:hypothetical protein